MPYKFELISTQWDKPEKYVKIMEGDEILALIHQKAIDIISKEVYTDSESDKIYICVKATSGTIEMPVKDEAEATKVYQDICTCVFQQ